jgi:hypothetical protein
MQIEITKNIASTIYIHTPETSWALFMYSPTGDLFLSSDWGSYTHRWKGFGDNFEHFLKGLSVEYFVDKLSKPDVNQHKPHSKQKEILTLLVGHFIEALKNQILVEKSVIEATIEIKGELIDTHNDFESWLKTVSTYVQRFGFNKKVIHVNKNGFNTTGYDLKNFEDKNVFPVKSYLLLSETVEPTPFKSISNN